MRQLALGMGAFGIALQGWAHEGHGMPGTSHWHAADAWGFALAVGVVAALIWWGGRDR